MLGLMLPTWFLSMWISNTATTAMMIPIANAILVQLKEAKEEAETNGHLAIETGKSFLKCCGGTKSAGVRIKSVLRKEYDSLGPVNIGGYLAIIETSEEDELLKSYVAIIVPSKDYWIGGSDLATEGVFIWENTSATVNLPTSTLFQGWAQGHPGIDNQHCMMLGYQLDFKWNDATCDYPRDYVCEQN
ncbi:SLC13A2_3_5 [Mytilus edulis]|uniref:SLC13A2_3_5 n=1 Tax=Mytilus edulis TaxID=6550 RepID=A0A8S3TR52_MYTED|nr:SLC13A2_3_5 [Mytilus edulis]